MKDEFDFLITMRMGINRFHVVKRNKNLVLTIPNGEEIIAELDEDGWALFWKEISSAGIWKYEKEYVQEALVCDGTSWKISAKHEGREVSSGGGNAYPGVKGTRFGVKFKKLLNLLNKQFPDGNDIGLWDM